MIEKVVDKVLDFGVKHERATNIVFRGLFVMTAPFEKQGRKEMADRAYMEAAQFGHVSREVRALGWVLGKLGNTQINQSMERGMVDYSEGRTPTAMLEAYQRTHRVINPEDLSKLGGNHG